MKLKNNIIKLQKISKIYYLLLLFIIIGIISFAIPSLARYKNRVTITDTKVWDGTVAASYKKGSGSKNDPYIISTGSELAYFSNMLKTTNYQDTYFSLTNDIILNDGVFKYDQANGPTYINNNKTMYLKEYTNNLYDDSSQNTLSEIKVNNFTPLANFKGHFDGNAYTIYGLYITSNESEELGLFTNLEGEVKDLSVKNALIYGGTTTGGIASKATNTTLKNISYEGVVIGNNDSKENTITIDLPDQIYNNENNTKEKEIELTSKLNEINTIPTSITISGTCQSDLTTGNITINDISIASCNNNTFEINLNNIITNKLTITSNDNNLSTYQLTNLQYKINYTAGIAAGLVASANDLTLENTINKATVNAKQIAAGLVATSTNNLTINQSYNTGNISSNILASGLVANIDRAIGNTTISKSYNAGTISANQKSGIVGIINETPNPVNIVDVFQTTSDYSLDTIQNANVSIINSYQTVGNPIRVGVTTGTFTTTDLTTIKNNITFKIYTNQEALNSNPNSVWVLGKTNLPVLFIDDILESKITINVNNKSWNNLSSELETYYYSTNLTFNIEEKDSTNPVQEIYYYISNKNLSTEEINNITEWQKFETIISLKEENSYIIYAKAIDYNGNITYLNTDLLILDNTSPTAEISYDNYKWTNYKNNLDTVYISSEITINLNAIDTSSDIKELKYYITDKILSKEELKTIKEEWIDYQTPITIDKKGSSIIYLKAIDNALNETYINSDYIIYGGYNQNKVYLGENEITDYSNISITSNSTIAFNYEYDDTNNYQDNYTHNLVTNILLPENTKITLIDNLKNKIYTYEIENSEDLYNYQDSCKNQVDCQKTATYPFTLFKEVGTATNKKIYQEENKDNTKESFMIILDFSNTNITSNYDNIYTLIQIKEDNNIVRSTLKDSLKYFTLYNNKEGRISLASNYNSDIVYNSNSVNEIAIETKIDYQTINNQQIIDTTLQNKTTTLAVKLVDSNNKIVDKKYLKNLEFKIGDKSYSPDETGIVRMNLESNNATLKIITNKDNITLKDDSYHFEISSYLSNDGLYETSTSSNSLKIPIIYEKDYKLSSYNFNVITSKENKILSKMQDVSTLKFDILEQGNFTNPNIRISLYQKDQLTAYNQEYSLINLKEYSNDNLQPLSENIYYVTNNPISYSQTNKTYNHFNLNLLTSRLSPGGYKLVFELYEEDKKIGEIPHRFIIK